MSETSSKVLLGIGIAMLAGMTYMTVSNVSRNVTETGRGYAVPELREHLTEVRSIDVTAANDQDVLTFKREAQEWTVEQKTGYPADSAAVNALLRKLADSRLLEVKTTIEQRYPELGVEDVKSPQAKGVKLTLSGLAIPVRLIIGSTEANPERTYVRRAEDRKAWLAQGNLQINRDPSSWLDRSLLDVAPERIAAIAVSGANSKTIRLTRDKPDEPAFRLIEGSKPRIIDAGMVGALPSALSGLTLVDVNADSQRTSDATTRLRFETFDGMGLDLQTSPQSGMCYLRLTASLDPKRSEARMKAEQNQAKASFDASGKPSAEAPLAVTDPDKDLRQRMQEAEAAVNKLQRRFLGREFTLPEASCARFVPSPELQKFTAETVKPAGGKATKGKRR